MLELSAIFQCTVESTPVEERRAGIQSGSKALRGKVEENDAKKYVVETGAGVVQTDEAELQQVPITIP